MDRVISFHHVADEVEPRIREGPGSNIEEIVICSPDYTLSPWCQYELYQAIAKQPSLAEGKIIPITCGKCSTLPPVITSVVALAENDWNFSHRLRAAICRTHRASQ